jgi:hypothetical protein
MIFRKARQPHDVLASGTFHRSLRHPFLDECIGNSQLSRYGFGADDDVDGVHHVVGERHKSAFSSAHALFQARLENHPNENLKYYVIVKANEKSTELSNRVCKNL